MASTGTLPKDAVVEDSEDDGDIYDDEYSPNITQEALDVNEDGGSPEASSEALGVDDDVFRLPAQAFNHFLQIVRHAPEIANAINIGKAVTQDKSHYKPQEPPGHEAFHPTAQGDGDVPLNPHLHGIALPPGRVGCSKYVDHLSSYDTLITRLLGDELSASNAWGVTMIIRENSGKRLCD
jgi:hypothetical protein